MATKAQAKLNQAFAFHQKGHLPQAKALYEEILVMQPKHFDSLHLLGVIAYQTKNHQRAVDLIGKAIELYPKNAAFYSNRGLALQELKQLDAAVASYDKAIALKADYAEAYSNRGNVLQELKQLDAAVASYDKAIALKADYAEAYYNRGNALKELKRLDVAVASYDKAIALKADYAEAYSNRGLVLQELKQLDAAVASYDKAIALKADYAEAYSNRGNVLQKLKQLDAAIASYNQAIALKADYAEAYSNRGNALKKLKQLDAAVASYDKAIALKADYAEAYYNRGNALQELKQLDAAVASYDKAIALKADYAEAYSNRGLVLQELKQLDAAVASYDKAIALKPDFAGAYWNKSLALLLFGHFDRGWEFYEFGWGIQYGRGNKQNFVQPLWLGNNPLEGKTILLHSEQGFGDTIQFCRYAKLVADLGAQVILEVEKPLMSLLANLDGVAQLVAKGSNLPAFDYQCPLLSLPLAFKTNIKTIPTSIKYLGGEPSKIAQWQSKLGEKIKPRIGLVWSGGTTHHNDRNRSLLLSYLIQHLPTDFQYVSLQKEIRDVDQPTIQSNPNILNFANELNDFSDTAALCELMDVVISVDTSVAHLAGALGKPTWVLLPFGPDWRWLLDRTDSPWYPSVKLYRQEKIGDWDSVFQRVKADLLLLLR